MDLPLELVLVYTSAVAVALAAVLAITKLAHRQVLRWQGVRKAHYVAAVGELITRRATPFSPSRSWADDPLFAEVLAEYRRLLAGQEREAVDAIAAAVGVNEKLMARARRRLPGSRRLQAIVNLVELADSSHLPFLRRLLTDRNVHARIQAVRGLAQLGDVEAIPDILEELRTAGQWEAARIADALTHMGPKAVEPICRWVEEAIAEPGCPVTAVALCARVLGLIGDPRAEPVLISLLASPHPDWRVAAASALEHAGTAAAVEALLARLEDRSAKVRARVAVALGATADPTVARSVAALLNDEVWWVRQNAAEALCSLPGGVAHLVVAASGQDRYAADAALNQLTISGTLARAAERTAEGTATEIDLRLLELSAARP